MKLSNTLNEDLNKLLIKLNQVYDKKEELKNRLKEELGTKHVDLLAIDNNVYTIYIGFEEEREDIQEIAESIGYKLEKEFKKENGSIYRLVTNPRR